MSLINLDVKKKCDVAILNAVESDSDTFKRRQK